MIKDTLAQSPDSMIAAQDTSSDHIIFIPAGKLDADQYMVSDLDGVTESLFGSGNMNFLMMQSAQTNELAAARGNPDFSAQGDLHLPVLDTASSSRSLPGTGNGHDYFDASAPRTTPQFSEEFGAFDTSGTAGNALAATTLSDTSLSSSGNFSSPFSFVQNISGDGPSLSPISPSTPANGVNGTSGTNGTNGTNGTDGTNGTGGTGDTIVNNVTEVIENITNNTIEDTTNLIENITNNATDLLTTITNNVFNTINNILDGGPELSPIGLNLLLDLDQLTNLNLDIFSGDNIFSIIDETLDISLLTDLTDSIADIATLLNVNLLLFPFHPDNSPDDQDLTILGDFHLPILPPVDLAIPLDPVEALLGDIDLNVDLTNELLNGLLGGEDEADTDLDIGTGIALLDQTVLDDGLDVLLNPVENILGDIDLGAGLDFDLFGTNETDNATGDTDLTLPLDLDIGNTDILNDALNIDLDFVEAITGDIDLDLTIATDLLGQAADNLLDPENGGDANGGPLDFVGDLAGGLISPLLPQGAGDDTDLSADLTGSLLDNPLLGNTLDITLDPVEDLLGDIDAAPLAGIDLLGTGSGTHTDIFSAIDIDFIDSPLLDGALDDSLSLSTLLPTDAALDLPVAIDLLGDIAPPFVDGGPGGSSEPTLLSEAGDLMSDIVADIVQPHDDGFLSGILSPVDDALSTAFDLLQSTPDSGSILDLSILDTTQNIVSDLVWTESLLPDATDILGSGLGGDAASFLPDPSAVIPDLAATASNLLGGSNGEKLFGGLFG